MERGGASVIPVRKPFHDEDHWWDPNLANPFTEERIRIPTRARRFERGSSPAKYLLPTTVKIRKVPTRRTPMTVPSTTQNPAGTRRRRLQHLIGRDSGMTTTAMTSRLMVAMDGSTRSGTSGGRTAPRIRDFRPRPSVIEVPHTTCICLLRVLLGASQSALGHHRIKRIFSILTSLCSVQCLQPCMQHHQQTGSQGQASVCSPVIDQ